MRPAHSFVAALLTGYELSSADCSLIFDTHTCMTRKCNSIEISDLYEVDEVLRLYRQ